MPAGRLDLLFAQFDVHAVSNYDFMVDVDVRAWEITFALPIMMLSEWLRWRWGESLEND